MWSSALRTGIVFDDSLISSRAIRQKTERLRAKTTVDLARTSLPTRAFSTDLNFPSPTALVAGNSRVDHLRRLETIDTFPRSDRQRCTAQRNNRLGLVFFAEGQGARWERMHPNKQGERSVNMYVILCMVAALRGGSTQKSPPQVEKQEVRFAYRRSRSAIIGVPDLHRDSRPSQPSPSPLHCPVFVHNGKALYHG